MLHQKYLLIGGAFALLLTGCEVTEQAVDPVPSIDFAANQLVLNSEISGTYQVYTVDTETGESQVLTDEPDYDHWWPRISPDRKRLLYYRAPVWAQQSYAQAELWETDALGLSHRKIIDMADYGWSLQAHAEWSPDGSQLVMCAGIDGVLQLVTTDDTGQSPVQLTYDGQWNCDPSWSPSGDSILFNRCETPACGGDKLPDLEIYRLSLLNDQMQRLTYDSIADYDPYYSPDGEQIAWLRLEDPDAFAGVGAWSIYLMNPDGSAAGPVISDGFLNSKPGWSIAGDKIYFHRIDESTNGKWQVFEIAPDGTGLGKWEFHPGVNVEYPSIQ